MKKLLLFLLLSTALITSCKKDDKEPLEARGGSSVVNQYTTLNPTNRGTYFILDESGITVVVWRPQCDTIEVYNTNTRVLSARFIQPNSQSNPFTNVAITKNGQYVITQRDPDEIKLYSVTNNAFVRDLERVWNWIVMPDNNSILGFDNSLIIKTGIKKINFQTGIVETTDTIAEMTSPVIAGTRNNGTTYILFEYEIDLNDPLSPSRIVNVLVKSIQTHQIISEYTTAEKYLLNSHILNDDGTILSFLKDDSTTAGNFPIKTLDVVSGSHISNGIIQNGVNPPSYCFTSGPGSSQIIFMKTSSQHLSQAVISPSFSEASHTYTVNITTPNGFSFLDVNDYGTLVAASYVDIDVKSYIVFWQAQ